MKRTFLSILLLLMSMSLLFSCKDGNKGADEKPDAPTGGLIYGDEIETYIVTNIQYGEFEFDMFQELYNTLVADTDGYYTYVSDATEKQEREIVVGSTNRDVTKKAEEYLQRRIRREIRYSPDEDYAAQDTVGYAIYSDGSSVAIVWNDFHVASIALEFFNENYIQVTDNLVLEEGYIKTGVFSLDTYLTERGDKIIADAWAEYEEHAGAGITAAMKKLYTLYTDEMVSWYANLYDPEIGGWYWSNSGRDNEGYLPSIEETYEALNFISNSGMAEMFGGDWAKAIPDWLKEQIGNFVYNLQDADGFYYHPQWPKEYINENGFQSRITRDKGSATVILRNLGIKPKYSSYSSEVPLTGRLDSSSVAAVSKVVPAAEMLWQYQSAENFREYLDGLEAELLTATSWANKFYAWGNNFQSTVGYINSNPEIRSMLIEFFDKYQDPISGMWKSSSQAIDYDATNGLHKIGSVYNSIGAKLNYVEKMVESVFAILSWTVEEKPAAAGVDVYNAWSCFPYIYTNLRKTGDGTEAEREARCQAIKDRVYEVAPSLIAITFDQIVGFRMEDGSFTYSRGEGTPRAQGCPIAVTGVLEGNVNGTSVAHFALIDHINKGLELENYYVPTFTEKERVDFMRILENLGPVIKIEAEPAEEYIHDFESVSAGSLPEDIAVKIDATKVLTEGSSILVDRLDNGNNVLRFAGRPKTVENGRNYQASVQIENTHKNANATIIEFKLCIESTSRPTAALIEILCRHQIGGAPALSLRVGYAASKLISLYDSVGVKICDIGKADEIIDLRIEYYPTQEIYKIFVNDAYRGSSNTTYNGTAKHALLGSVSLGTPSGGYGDYWLDDLNFRNTFKAFEETDDETITYPVSYETFEGSYTTVEKTVGTKKVEDIKFASGLEVTYTGKSNDHGATASVITETDGENKYLNITAPKRVNTNDRSHSITFLPEQCALKPNVYVFDLDLKIDGKLSDGSDCFKNAIQLLLYSGDSKKYIQYSMSTDTSGNVSFGGVNVCTYDEWYSIRFVIDMAGDVIDAYAKNGEGEYALLGRLGDASSATSSSNKTVSSLGDQIGSVIFSGSNGTASGFSINIDNIALYTTKIEGYGGNPDSPSEPSNPSTPSTPTQPTPGVVSEPRVEGFDGNVETTYNVVDGIFCPESGITTEFNTASHTNSTGKTGAWVVDDGSGNKVLNLYSPGRLGGSTDRAVAIAVPFLDMLTDKPNAYVFKMDVEFQKDIKSPAAAISPTPAEILLRATNGKYSQVEIMSTKDGKLAICSVAPDKDTENKNVVIGEWNEKISLTIVLFDGELRIYVSDVLVGIMSTPYVGNEFGTLGALDKISFAPYNAGGQIDILIDNVSAYSTALDGDTVDNEIVSPIK